MNKEDTIIQRKKYLSLLDSNISSFLSGTGKNMALLGPKYSGKTSIVKKYLQNLKDILPVYINLNKLGMSPENFAVEFIGNVCFSFLKKPISDYKKFINIENLLNLVSEIKSAKAHEIIKSVNNEILKIKPDQRFLVQQAFNFPNSLANEKDKKILIVLDNFENLLDLNNFSQIKDVFSLINFNHENVRYVVTSSAINEVKKLLRNFEVVEIESLDKNEVSELVKNFTGKTDQKLADEILKLSFGIPAVAANILKGYSQLKDAKKAFISELLWKNHSLHNYCSDSLNYYLNRTRGQVLSKIILKVIASENELRLSEIAKKIYRSAPVTKSLLERLISADIIHKKDSRFYFRNPILKLWLKLTSRGYEFDNEPNEEDYKEVQNQI